jgi:probable HAF family extracellular repeat protein
MALFVGCVGSQLRSDATSFTYTILDVPPSTIAVYGINDAGEIVGTFASGNKQEGFVGSRSQGFTSIDPPGSVQTQATGINNAGQVVGWFLPPGTGERGTNGFLYNAGTFTTIHVPGARSTQANGINDAGQVVGFIPNPQTGYALGFLDSAGAFSFIAFPGATGGTLANGINSSGQIVGGFDGPPFLINTDSHGFLDDHGTFTRIDAPGGYSTTAEGINNRGQIVGTFVNTSGFNIAPEGFLYEDGTFSFIDVPGSTDTGAFGINDAGQIVGVATFAGGRESFFLATPLPKSVPEPATGAIIGLGIAALWRLRERTE